MDEQKERRGKEMQVNGQRKRVKERQEGRWTE